MHFIKWWKENASWVTVWCWCSTSKDCDRSVKHLAVWTLCLKYLRPILMLLSRKDSTSNLKTCSYHITDSSTPGLKDSGSMRRTVSTFTVFLDLYSMQLHLSVCDPIPHLSSIWAPSCYLPFEWRFCSIYLRLQVRQARWLFLCKWSSEQPWDFLPRRTQSDINQGDSQTFLCPS